MELGYELVKEHLFFRKELRETVYWFIRLRWVAVGVAFAGSWAVYFLWRELPILPLNGILFFVILYNIIFHFIGKRLKLLKPQEVKPFAIFAHTQISLDLLALYLLIYFTGSIYSPLLILVIFHNILAGILLSPISYFMYGIVTIMALGGLITLHKFSILPFQPILLQSLFSPNSLEFHGMLALYFTFTAVILITGFLITSVKLSLKTKGRELLSVSKKPDASAPKLTALYEMVKEMGLCSDLKELMDSATRNAARIMRVKACSIKLLDDQGKTLKFAFTYGLSEDYVSKGSIDIDKSPINRKVIEGSFYAIGKIDEKDYSQYPEDIQREGIASIVYMPLRVEKMVLGVFCVYSNVAYYFADSDVKFFSLMADLTALAIENLKSELDRTWFLQKSAHQLRSPFNAIYSMLKMIRKGYLGPINQDQKETIERCEKRIEMLGDLIKDLLKLGIKRADIYKTIIQPVDIVKIMNVLDSLYRTQALEKGVDITFDIDELIPQIMADKKLIDELLTNLISNAIKYTPPGGNVRVSLTKESKDRVRLEVFDTGIGIPEKDMPRLFSEFFRAENAKAFAEEGTGLGLVIIKEILDRIKGTISVKSKVGEGTCFTCFLPSV